jgi:hypothetical protein
MFRKEDAVGRNGRHVAVLCAAPLPRVGIGVIVFYLFLHCHTPHSRHSCCCRARLAKGAMTPLREVPASIPRPPYVGRKTTPFKETIQTHDAKVCMTSPRLATGPAPILRFLCFPEVRSADLLLTLYSFTAGNREDESSREACCRGAGEGRGACEGELRCAMPH